jgi:porphobilinogen synthase
MQDLVRETVLNTSDFIYPLFIKEGLKTPTPIPSMPGINQIGLSHLKAEIASIKAHDIKGVILFGLPLKKDDDGKISIQKDGIIQQAITEIKQLAPQLVVISDLCFCEYLTHGHCGIVDNHYVDNDKTLEKLNLQALSHAEAGVDMIAPSGMMDGVIQSLRTSLDAHHFEKVGLLGYSAKYCSSLYDPFREAADGAPQFGDRKQYQMDPSNALEAIREVNLDIKEGADIVMVKPAMFYLDIINKIKIEFPEIPLCAYQVSGEYALIKQGAKAGILNEHKAMIESLTAIKRAGANIIITYFAKEINRHINQ